MVQDGANVHVSVVSFWEFLLKSRYHDLGITFEEMRQVVKALDASLLAIDLQHLQTLQSLPFVGKHRDPFDRLIISQAISEGYVLVGKDREFPKYCKTCRRTQPRYSLGVKVYSLRRASTGLTDAARRAGM